MSTEIAIGYFNKYIMYTFTWSKISLNIYVLNWKYFALMFEVSSLKFVFPYWDPVKYISSEYEGPQALYLMSYR